MVPAHVVQSLPGFGRPSDTQVQQQIDNIVQLSSALMIPRREKIYCDWAVNISMRCLQIRQHGSLWVLTMEPQTGTVVPLAVMAVVPVLVATGSKARGKTSATTVACKGDPLRQDGGGARLDAGSRLAQELKEKFMLCLPRFGLRSPSICISTSEMVHPLVIETTFKPPPTAVAAQRSKSAPAPPPACTSSLLSQT
ncbi:hypothetical protein LZ554_006646 [Drepanopeziza brunnea f. sp. 'monogermtubi']|nr:hypothetical protein LZ554_006646 [Drepanopeziza brunnea f. sp. 'monogermtubi']